LPDFVRQSLIDLADLQTVRRLVEWEGLYAGLQESRVRELVMAVNEIATNALIHGSPPATLRIWKVDGDVVCEVSDAGSGIEDPMAGRRRPDTTRPGGRGLWIARMLCDGVEIGSTEEGTIVRLQMSASNSVTPPGEGWLARAVRGG